MLKDMDESTAQPQGTKRRTVKVSARRRLLQDVVVEVDDLGNVFLDGERLGSVEKSHRTYSPPLHRGSRIVRYHKQVPCWRANGTQTGFRHRGDSTFDSRADAIAHLVVAHRDSK
jgi:hypothetical protein